MRLHLQDRGGPVQGLDPALLIRADGTTAFSGLIQVKTDHINEPGFQLQVGGAGMASASTPYFFGVSITATIFDGSVHPRAA